MQPSRNIDGLIAIMAALRDKDTGCPWDIAQDFNSIAPYTIEEAYEVADAITRGDILDLREELGDLLLQVVFHAQIAQEAGQFDFGGVVEAITTKLIRRHPHVFDKARALTADDVKGLWTAIKAEEKAERSAARSATGMQPSDDRGLLADVPMPLPGLTRAAKLQAKAASVGFDWDDVRDVMSKLREETAEIEAALEAGDPAALAEEIGDLLFTAANLARHAKCEPEALVRAANAKFETRFRFIEHALAAQNKPLATATLTEMEALWQQAKVAKA